MVHFKKLFTNNDPDVKREWQCHRFCCFGINSTWIILRNEYTVSIKTCIFQCFATTEQLQLWVCNNLYSDLASCRLGTLFITSLFNALVLSRVFGGATVLLTIARTSCHHAWRMPSLATNYVTVFDFRFSVAWKLGQIMRFVIFYCQLSTPRLHCYSIWIHLSVACIVM